MYLYYSCPYCGASLDPGEICDCQIENSGLTENSSPKNTQPTETSNSEEG